MPYQIIFTDELYHHGVKGQKWGIRHYQNEDGSYKSGAQGRYNSDGKPGVNTGHISRNNKLTINKPKVNKLSKSNSKGKDNKKKNDNLNKNKDKKPKKKMSTKKKVAIGVGVVGAAAGIAAYKYRKYIKKEYVDTLLRTNGIEKSPNIDYAYGKNMSDMKSYLNNNGGSTRVSDFVKDTIKRKRL